MPSLLDDIQQIQTQSLQEIDQAQTLEALESVRLKFLGRKEGQLTKILQALPTLSPEEKKEVGRQANEIKRALEGALDRKKQSLEEAQLSRSLSQEAQDLTLPGAPLSRGGAHPLTQVMEEIVAV